MQIAPKKRDKHLEKQGIFFNFVQNSRLKTRQKSLDIWVENGNNIAFKAEMKPYLDNLKFFTLLNHRLIKLNIEEDVQFCLKLDICSTIPVLEGEYLVKLAI